MSLFLVEQEFLLIGGLVKLQCRDRTHSVGREETKGQRKVLYSRFFCVST